MWVTLDDPWVQVAILDDEQREQINHWYELHLLNYYQCFDHDEPLGGEG